VTIALRPRHPAALAAYARAVSTPGSGHYGHYLTPRAFGARFGAGARRIDAVTAALRAGGLHPGRPSAGGLSIPFTATATQIARPGGVHAALTSALPRAARAAVQAVVGLDGALAAHPLAVRPPRRADPRARRSDVRHGAASTGAGPQPCATATSNASIVGANTDQTIAQAYGFDPLYAAGDEGAGTTVAVYELEPDDPSDIAAFQRCYGTQTQISYVHVDGGAGRGAGSDEAAFDIENLIGFAPAARLLVYQGPNSASGLPGSGPYDVFSAIVNQDGAQVVSVSWGQCEAQLGRAAEHAENTLFEQAAVEGQTIVAAAGDSGGEDCDTGGRHSSLAPAVDDPASEPEVLGVGGTTLVSTDPLQETVWNSGSAGGGATGGGISSAWPMAPDQRDTPGWLGIRRAVARGPACGQTRGYCREVPDVSADADPTTGYEIYWNGADTEPEPSGWQALGGTSGAAPVWAAVVALADASPACAGSPLGVVGPALYRAAAGHYDADFHDVTRGDNDFTGTDGGRWAASRDYDLATGLGTPDAAALAASLCADSVRLSRPHVQSSAVRAAVGLRLRARDVRGATLAYRAAHLPPGVRVNARTGRLSGRPTKSGRYHVRVGVADGRGSRAAQTFTWDVGGAPRLTAVRLGHDRLALTVHSGRHVPLLRRLRIHVPRGLRVAASAHANARATVRVGGSVVTVSLRSPAATVRIRIPVRGTTSAARVVVAVRAGSTGTSTLSLALAGGL
jgi:hypothetical protein